MDFSEEEEFEFRRRREEDEEFEFRRRRESEASAAPVEDEGIDLQDVRGAGSRLLKGATFGFGDEIAGGIRSLLPDAAYDFGEGVSMEKQDMGDAYAMYRDDARATDEEFARENPGSALAIEIAGGLISPANKLGGAVKATKGGLARAVGRGAAEGAAYGAGEGEGDLASQLQSAKEGAMFGAGGTAALSGLGGIAGRVASNERVKTALGKGKDFIPIHIADPTSRLGKFYRDTVGTAIGGHGALGKQESAAFRRNPKLAALTDDIAESIPDTVGTRTAVKDLRNSMSDQKRIDLSANKAEKKSMLRQATAASRAKVNDIAAEPVAAAKARETAIAQQTARNEAAGVARAAESAQDTKALQRLAAQEADPAGALKNTDLNDTQAVSEGLKKYWRNDAFQEVKSRPFTWDEGIKARLIDEMEGDAAFKNAVGNDLRKIDSLRSKLTDIDNIDDLSGTEFVDALLGGKGTGRIVDAGGSPILKKTADDTIDGDVLMEIRNVFARGANDSRGMNSYAQRQFAQEFDRSIRKQLDTGAREAFDANKSKYTSYLSYRDAMEKATDEIDGPTIKQMRDAAKRYGDKGMNNFPLAAQSKPLRMKEKGLQQAARNERKALAEAKKMATAQNKEQRYLASQAAKNERQGLTQARDAINDKASNKSDRLSQRERAAKNRIDRETEGMLKDSGSTLNKVAATSILGLPLGGFSIIGALPAGIVTAAGLSTQTAQRLLAGQAGAQKALAKALESGDTALATRILSRLAAGRSQENN